MKHESLKLALETSALAKDVLKQVNRLVAENKALKERLADPMREVQRLGQEIEQEPKIGCVNHDCDQCKPQRKWVELTEQQRNDIEDACEMIIGKPAFDLIDAASKRNNL